MDSFKSHLEIWIKQFILEVENSRLSSKVKGITFNLIENSGIYRMEIVGTDDFNIDDPDWACEEIISSSNRSIGIPPEVHSDSWEVCLGYASILIEELMSESVLFRNYIEKIDGVGIGFVDGDLKILHGV